MMGKIEKLEARNAELAAKLASKDASPSPAASENVEIFDHFQDDGDLGLARAAPPTSTTLRCWFRNFPRARSRTSISLIGVPSKVSTDQSCTIQETGRCSWSETDRRRASEGGGSAGPDQRP